jgi:hypothetical protein
MRDTINFDWLTRSRRARLLALGTLVIGVLLAGCIAGFLTTPTVGDAGAVQSASSTAPSADPPAEVASTRPSGGVRAHSLTTHPSKQVMERMLKVSQCMRRHGISWFPNPTTSVPSSMAGIGMVSDVNGAILVIASALVTRSGPAYGQAVAGCGHGLLGQPGNQ